jgi:hypothetical protein
MDRVGRELDQELSSSGFGAALAPDQPVNDLSSVVKRKKPKPAPPPTGNPLVPELPTLGKRKAEEEPERDEKKQRVE